MSERTSFVFLQIDGGLPLHVEGAVRYSPYLPDLGPAAGSAGKPGSSRTVTCVDIQVRCALVVRRMHQYGGWSRLSGPCCWACFLTLGLLTRLFSPSSPLHFDIQDEAEGIKTFTLAVPTGLDHKAGQFASFDIEVHHHWDELQTRRRACVRSTCRENQNC